MPLSLVVSDEDINKKLRLLCIRNPYVAALDTQTAALDSLT
jgi:hypothetical protein